MYNEQFYQEERQINRAMDNLEETKSKLREEILNLQLQNSILINTMKEIAVKYDEENTPEQDTILCKYLIARAQEALRQVEPETTNLHPAFNDIVNSHFNPKREL